MPTLHDYQALRATHKDAIDDARRLEERMHEVATDLVNEAFGTKYESDTLGIGVHACDKSPIETCVYNTDDDPARDSCLFCFEPHERK